MEKMAVLSSSLKIGGSVLGVAVIAIVLLWGLYEEGYWRFNFISRDEFPVQGIDVSRHQGEINWKSVPRDEYSFAYIKATEGGDFTDANFQRNWEGAQRAGFIVGAYHYFTLCRDGKEQAENFIKTVPRFAGSLPPAVDLEFEGNCAKRPTEGVFASSLADFVSAIESHYGVKPFFYTTSDFHEAYINDSGIENGGLWISNIVYRPRHPWAIWQYAHNARVDGIAGPVDVNAYLGNEAGFRDALLK